MKLYTFIKLGNGEITFSKRNKIKVKEFYSLSNLKEFYSNIYTSKPHPLYVKIDNEYFTKVVDCDNTIRYLHYDKDSDSGCYKYIQLTLFPDPSFSCWYSDNMYEEDKDIDIIYDVEELKVFPSSITEHKIRISQLEYQVSQLNALVESQKGLMEDKDKEIKRLNVWIENVKSFK